jgi:predicted enzyme related to lactoylglutathione lyase
MSATRTDASVLAVPTARTVTSLTDALRLVARFGGTIASETRTAPGIGSWALVTDRDGNDLVLWEDAAPAV